MRRLVSIIGMVSLVMNMGALTSEVQAASLSDLSSRAKQARSKVNALKKGRWSAQEKIEAIVFRKVWVAS